MASPQYSGALRCLRCVHYGDGAQQWIERPIGRLLSLVNVARSIALVSDHQLGGSIQGPWVIKELSLELFI
jgi:hypothetical protein